MPWFIETPLLSNAGITKDSDLEKFIVGLQPMKRLGKSEEIASSFIFLASNESSFITGSALEIEGGFFSSIVSIFKNNMMSIKKVWIENNCTACGLCEDLCPDVFKIEEVASVIKGADFSK